MRRTAIRVIVGAAIALSFSWVLSIAHAEPPAGMKLYAFSSGALTVPKSLLQTGAPATPTTVPVGFYVVRHPKGNVLFDTGNNDRILTDDKYWGNFMGMNPVRTPDVAIDVQLQKIGLKPDDIKYVVVGHMHLDHGGNVGKFPKSTLVVQKDEIRNAFWPEPGTAGLTRKTLHRTVNELIAVWEEVAGVRDTLVLTAHAADAHLEALSTIRTVGRVRVVDILALETLAPLREAHTGRWHGGEVDSSLMLHLAPELVDLAAMPATLAASAEKGARFYEAIVSTLAKRLT